MYEELIQLRKALATATERQNGTAVRYRVWLGARAATRVARGLERV